MLWTKTSLEKNAKVVLLIFNFTRWFQFSSSNRLFEKCFPLTTLVHWKIDKFVCFWINFSLNTFTRFFSLSWWLYSDDAMDRRKLGLKSVYFISYAAKNKRLRKCCSQVKWIVFDNFHLFFCSCIYIMWFTRQAGNEFGKKKE